jgi:hypothetical protein
MTAPILSLWASTQDALSENPGERRGLDGVLNLLYL